MPWQGNALTDDNIDIPGDGMSVDGDIPATYVPARNIIFLSLGVSFAETIGAEAVFIGAHQLDFSNYPDCRDTFFESYQKTIDRGTKSGSGGDSVSVKTPIINMTKKEIVEEGLRLGVPFQYTWSCYRGDDAPCGYCESCVLRAKGFEEAGAADPLISGSGKNEDS